MQKMETCSTPLEKEMFLNKINHVSAIEPAWLCWSVSMLITDPCSNSRAGTDGDLKIKLIPHLEQFNSPGTLASSLEMTTAILKSEPL